MLLGMYCGLDVTAERTIGYQEFIWVPVVKEECFGMIRREGTGLTSDIGVGLVGEQRKFRSVVENDAGKCGNSTKYDGMIVTKP